MANESFPLQISRELGGINERLNSIEKKLDEAIKEKQVEHETIWNTIDKAREKINDQHGVIRWMIGVGVGLQAIWAIILGFIKNH